MGEVPRIGKRILAAEDSESCRILLRQFLKNSPHTVVFAEDGARAVELFLSGQFDLILMDKQMPGMDGLTATRAIRAREREQNRHPIFIVALTADALPRHIEASYSAGCDAHLSKPISRLQLLEMIEGVRPCRASQQAEKLTEFVNRGRVSGIVPL